MERIYKINMLRLLAKLLPLLIHEAVDLIKEKRKEKQLKKQQNESDKINS